MSFDYRRLLTLYMRVLSEVEDIAVDGYVRPKWITKDEWAELRRLNNEVRKPEVW